MTTSISFWWRSDDFAAFLPWIKATAAGDKRHYAHPRLDLKSGAPASVVRAALDFKASCVHCHKPIRPFRQRENDRSIYFGVTCEQYLSLRCSRGARASSAYSEIWALLKGSQPPQGGLFP